MTVETGFPGLSPAGAQDPRKTSGVVSRINQGKMNVVGTVTLVTSASATTVVWPTIGVSSMPTLQPSSATAAAETPQPYVLAADVTAKVGFVITHTVTATATRTYRFSVLG